MSAWWRRLALGIDWLSLGGALTAALGFLLPWFKRADDYEWWYSGWLYLSHAAAGGSPGGWTLPVLLLLGVAAAAALAGLRSPGAAYTAAIAGVAAVTWSVVAVAAAWGAMVAVSGPGGSAGEDFDRVALAPVSLGIPILALGAAMLVTGALRTVVVTALRQAPRM